MVGRVPIRVSAENGDIRRGDLLVSASVPGAAMKYNPRTAPADTPIGIIGVALDTYDAPTTTNASATGIIMGLVRTGWVNGNESTPSEIANDLLAIANAETGVVTDTDTDLTISHTDAGTITLASGNLNGASLINVRSIVGANNRWEIDALGRFIGREDADGNTMDVYALGAPYAEYVISGSSVLENGMSTIVFDEDDRAVIDPDSAINVTVTLTGEEPSSGIRVIRKDTSGFVVKEIGGGQGSAEFDWVAQAKLDVIP
jgi:hypothetical protein